ncbi:MAG: hypothetical protein IJE77_00915 [Thermoguttaceae bacterium]|nr:hypothetical protein [Thermoguttaceae bacterium]
MKIQRAFARRRRRDARQTRQTRFLSLTRKIKETPMESKRSDVADLAQLQDRLLDAPAYR